MRHSETIDNLSDAKRLIDELEEENAALRQDVEDHRNLIAGWIELMSKNQEQKENNESE